MAKAETVVDEKLKEKADKNVKNDGWIRSWMMIEVMAVNKEATKSALEKHVDKMCKEKKTIVYKKDFKDIQRIENPRPNIPEAYTYVVELEVATETYDQLVFLAMNYGPSGIEILEPEKLKLDMGEAQSILNSISEMIHKFAAAGVGGVVINT